jgi:hypothetical protein
VTNGTSEGERKGRDRDESNSKPATVKIDQISEKNDANRRVSARQVTKRIGSMQEESSGSDLESDEGEEVDAKVFRPKRNKIQQDPESSSSRSSKQRKSAKGDVQVKENSVDFEHLKYRGSDTAAIGTRNRPENSKSDKHLFTGKRNRRDASPPEVIEEESLVMERIRHWKQECEAKTEAELWQELSRVEEELEKDTFGETQCQQAGDADVATLKGNAPSLNKSSERSNVQAESSYELERLENIRQSKRAN